MKLCMKSWKLAGFSFAVALLILMTANTSSAETDSCNCDNKIVIEIDEKDTIPFDENNLPTGQELLYAMSPSSKVKLRYGDVVHEISATDVAGCGDYCTDMDVEKIDGVWQVCCRGWLPGEAGSGCSETWPPCPQQPQ